MTLPLTAQLAPAAARLSLNDLINFQSDRCDFVVKNEIPNTTNALGIVTPTRLRAQAHSHTHTPTATTPILWLVVVS